MATGVRRLDKAEVDDVAEVLIALVDGLRQALCAPEPMSVARARGVLERHLTQLNLNASDLGLTGPPAYLYSG